MAQRRGNAMATKQIVMLVLFCFIIVQCEVAQASRSYVVGGLAGWTFGVESWANGKQFKAGDKLVFRYLRTAHNVVRVDHHGYRSCTVSKGAYITRTGNDHIKLVKGDNYFICNLPGHCPNGVRIKVKAT